MGAPGEPGEEPAGCLRQLGWLVALWAAGVLALAVVAALIRIAMNAVGLTA